MQRPLRPCKRCRGLTRNANGYCDKHQGIFEQLQRERLKKYDQKRGTRTERGYGNNWSRIRNAFLKSHPLCDKCESEGHVVAAEVVHHVDHDQFNNDLSNLQALCRECHEKHHGRKR